MAADWNKGVHRSVFSKPQNPTPPCLTEICYIWVFSHTLHVSDKSDLMRKSGCWHRSPRLAASHSLAFPSSGGEGLCDSTLRSLTSTWSTQYSNANTLPNVKAKRPSSMQGNIWITGNRHVSVWGAAGLTQPIIKIFLALKKQSGMWRWDFQIQLSLSY